MQSYAQYRGLMAAPGGAADPQPELQHEDSGVDDLLGLLPRSLLASPTMDEGGVVDDSSAAADRAPMSPFPAMHQLSSDVCHDAPLRRGADHDQESALDSKPAPAMLHGGGGMSIETERVLAYLTQRGKAALAAAAETKEQQRVQESLTALRDPSNSTKGEGAAGAPQTTTTLFAAASHVASLPAFLQPEPMLPPAAPATWGGGSGGGIFPATAAVASATTQQPYVPAASNACIGGGLLGPASEDLARRLGLPPPPPPGSELAAMAAAAWGWAAATRRGSGGGMMGQQGAMAAGSCGSFGPLMQPSSAAAAAVPPFFLPTQSPFFGSAGGAGAAAGSLALTEGFDGIGAQPTALVSRHLWCGNVMVADAETLAGTFRPFGPLESVRVFAGRTYAFVNFVFEEHAAAAKAALEMQVLPELTSAAPLLVRFQTR